jgi:formylglycine-generating enzyme required for sulfatase activity/energy-coupling factor transporter ATP-binding protein EcfA2
MPAVEIARDLAAVQPYPGLRPFETKEEFLFFGRESYTAELLRRLSERRFLAVVGSSGSGKSSLVRAGLLPALYRGRLIGATSRWRICVMRPGSAPLDNLATALAGQQVGSSSGADVRETVGRSSLGLVRAVRDSNLKEGESVLLVVDQFEELFRFASERKSEDGGAEARLFTASLLEVADASSAPLYVVLTMRSDFLGDCAQFPGLPEALSESQYLIPRLSREQRRQAIEQPLRLFGATITQQLVEQLLNDSGAESPSIQANEQYRGGAPDPLPVLQHALMRSYLEWNRADRPIDLLDYRKAGGMESALNKHAEQVFLEELDDTGRKWAERIFRCLTTTELQRPVRRPTPLADLYKVVGAGPEDTKKVDAVLAILQSPGNSFLKIQKDAMVDISHESLIWKWTRLADWVSKEAAGADLYRDLAKDANGKATWGEPKLSATLAVRHRDAWNEDWARQYHEGRFQDVEEFLWRSRQAVRKQRWWRWFGAAAAAGLLIFAVIAYYSSRQAFQKAQELDALKVVESGLAKEQTTLKDRLNGLNASQGATKEERDRIAKQKSDLEAQLAKSQHDSQKLTAQAQQSTDLLATVKSLQTRLEQAQKDRDDAVQARTPEPTLQRESERIASQLEARIKTLTSDLESAKAVKSEPRTTSKDEPAPLLPAALPAAQPNVGGALLPAKLRTNAEDGLVYTWIPPGKFKMGCSTGDSQCRENESPTHEVGISKGFWLGQTEVTQAAWRKVMKSHLSLFKGDQLPVEGVSWSEAAKYCETVGGRLPTEAEWEYAARGGNNSARYGELDAVAWYGKNSGNTTHPVGGKQANQVGLFDMLGNVWEWVWDDYGRYKSDAVVDPLVEITDAQFGVVRGGSWDDVPQDARTSIRIRVVPVHRYKDIGFRCVGEFR